MTELLLAPYPDVFLAATALTENVPSTLQPSWKSARA
jgi:hypothetical protein